MMRLFSSRAKYQQVNNGQQVAVDQDKAHLLEENWPVRHGRQCDCARQSFTRSYTICAVYIMFVGFVFGVGYASGVVLRSPSHKSLQSDRECAKRTSSFSM